MNSKEWKNVGKSETMNGGWMDGKKKGMNERIKEWMMDRYNH